MSATTHASTTPAPAQADPPSAAQAPAVTVTVPPPAPVLPSATGITALAEALPSAATFTDRQAAQNPTELSLSGSVSDQMVQPHRETSFQVPKSIFRKTDPNAKLTFSAKQSDGGPRPNWLTFDPGKLVFRGTPPADATGKLDLVVQAKDSHGNQVSVPVHVFIGGGGNVSGGGQAMTMLDRFSAHLKRSVANAEEALRKSFAREQAQTRAVVLEAERVRLMSDLHDGIAGQLVSILALCELRGNVADEITGAVQGALVDLRLVIASLEDSAEDLGMMLALFRERIEPQLAAFGIALHWRMGPLPEVSGLHPGATLNIFRILQEATINAARHSGSPAIALEAIPSPRPGLAIRLTVRDHGHGGVSRRPGSHGLNNMHRRAQSLGAELDIESLPTGTTVILDLPATLP